MPVQRMKSPGKNCLWIREISQIEIHIIQDHRYQFVLEKLENYQHNLEKIEERHSSLIISKKVSFSQDKVPPRSDDKLEKMKENYSYDFISVVCNRGRRGDKSTQNYNML